MNICAIQSTATALPRLSKPPPECRSLDNSNSNRNHRPLLEISPPTNRRRKIGMGNLAVSTTMRDRSKNRKPLQRGRNLSIEAIQTVQALKRANKNKNDNVVEPEESLEQVFVSKVRRLLKLDLMAVLRELLRQNESLLALKVYEDVRKEDWYKPQISLYAEIISVLGSNGLFEEVEQVFMELKMERSLKPDTNGFNALLGSLMSLNITGLAMEGLYLMISLGCEPEKSTFRVLINGLESKGETSLSAIVRREAQKYYGDSLEFLEEQEDMLMA